MQDSGRNTTVIVAIIGLIGAVTTALIANWDKFGPHTAKVAQPVSPPQQFIDRGPSVVAPAPVRQRDEPQATPNLAGVWHDPSNPSLRLGITQYGNRLSYASSGRTRGMTYQLTANGTIDGHSITTSYETRYQNGVVTTGKCNLSLSEDENQLQGPCDDSVAGRYSSLIVRE